MELNDALEEHKSKNVIHLEPAQTTESLSEPVVSGVIRHHAEFESKIDVAQRIEPTDEQSETIQELNREIEELREEIDQFKLKLEMIEDERDEMESKFLQEQILSSTLTQHLEDLKVVFR